MSSNKKPGEPLEPERWAKMEELDRKMKEEEEKYWARIEKKERAADVLSTLSLVVSIIVLLTTLVK